MAQEIVGRYWAKKNSLVKIGPSMTFFGKIKPKHEKWRLKSSPKSDHIEKRQKIVNKRSKCGERSSRPAATG